MYTGMPTTRVNVRLPDDLLERTDRLADVTGETRTGVVTAALRAHLRRLEADDDVEAAVVAAYLDGEVGLEALEALLDRRDAAAVRASKALLEGGDELVEELADAAGEAP